MSNKILHLLFLLMICFACGPSNLFGMEKESWFFQLPDYLQRQILENLPVEDLIRFAQTSRAAAALVPGLIITPDQIMDTFRRMTPDNVERLVRDLRQRFNQLSPIMREQIRRKFIDRYAQQLASYIFSQDSAGIQIPQFRRPGLAPGKRVTTTFFDGRQTIDYYSYERQHIALVPKKLPTVNLRQMSFDQLLDWFQERMLSSPYQQQKALRALGLL